MNYGDNTKRSFASVVKAPPPSKESNETKDNTKNQIGSSNSRQSKGNNKNPPKKILTRKPDIKQEDEEHSMEYSLFDIITQVQTSKSKPIKSKQPTKIIQKPKKKNHQVNPNLCAGERNITFRGKEREKPKQKKPTKLKQVIIQDRNAYQESTLIEINSDIKNEDDINDDKNVISNESKLDNTILIPKIPLKLCAREYCNAVISNELNTLVSELLSKLFQFQMRAKQKAPKKAKKRIVLGIREVERSILRGKSKAIIVAFNLEQSESLDVIVNNIINQAELRSIPVIFALKKSALGRTVGKKMNMSFASILSPDGAYELYKQVLELSSNLRKEKQQIDLWIKENNFNDCGDPIDTEYDVNPRYDKNSGITLDKYRYLTNKFKEDKPWK